MIFNRFKKNKKTDKTKKEKNERLIYEFDNGIIYCSEWNS